MSNNRDKHRVDAAEAAVGSTITRAVLGTFLLFPGFGTILGPAIGGVIGAPLAVMGKHRPDPFLGPQSEEQLVP